MYKLSRFLLIVAMLAGCYAGGLFVYMYWPSSAWGLAAVAALLVRRRRHVHLTTLGSARWANRGDLNRAGMIDAPRGLSVGHLLTNERGRLRAALWGLLNSRISAKEACQSVVAGLKKRGRSPLVRLAKAVHTVVFSPSGGGKGVSFIIPFLLWCRESCIVNDVKGENARITAEVRRRFGHRVVLLDPFREVTQNPDSINPLDFISPDSPTAIDDCVSLAKALVIRTGEEKDPHFNDGAEMHIAAVIAMVVFFGSAADGTRSLQTVRDILSHGDKLNQAIEVMVASTVADGMLSRMGGQLRHFIDKERSSTLTTASRHLRWLDTLAVAASTKTSTFDPAELLSGKMIVYMILPPNHSRAQSPLLRMWITTLFRSIVNGGLQERTLTHVLLDEAAQLGRLEAIEDAIDLYRGYGIRLQFYYQSMGQLKKCFPEGGDQTILSNTSQIFMGVNDQGLPGGAGTADFVSARLGEETIILKSGGTSRGTSTSWSRGGQGSSGGSESVNGNDNWAYQVRKLLHPSEVVALPSRVAITFTPGVPPIWTWLPRYYESNQSEQQTAYQRSMNAFHALCVAIIAFALMVGLAIRVSQKAIELHTGTFPYLTNQYQFDFSDRPDVPVDQSVPLTRRSHVQRLGH